jgi:hypothetical protein
MMVKTCGCCRLFEALPLVRSRSVFCLGADLDLQLHSFALPAFVLPIRHNVPLLLSTYDYLARL